MTDIGKHQHVPSYAFDPKEMEMGISIEMEHTDDRAVAEEIAKDHLSEFPDYYTRLKKMEAEASMRMRFSPCFDREKIEQIEHLVDPLLKRIEDIAGHPVEFPKEVQCMTEEEIAWGRQITGPGHEGGAGHGLMECHGKIDAWSCEIKVNPHMEPYDILANVVHESLHLAMPDKNELEVDDLTEKVLY